jgi:predicted ABC-class ATPase
MRTIDQLRRTLRLMDGRGYKTYQDIGGDWDFPRFRLSVDHVQSDPFATPTRVRAFVPADVAGIPLAARQTSSRTQGLQSLLARRFAQVAARESKRRGTGRSGDVYMESPGQEVIPQTAVRILEDGAVEARFMVGLPARGRRIAAREAIELLCEDVLAIVARSLNVDAVSEAEMMEHSLLNEDADHLRDWLKDLGLVAFVADGAILPRSSGVRDTPLAGSSVVPFEAPPELRMTAELPNRGAVTGMGLPQGVTLIVGGGFHGKSTLLQAVQWGVYNHCPGDGRELVVSDRATVKIRAEDGRSVVGVDISAFIDTLPLGKDTRFFSTPNASGSTSQAAGILEALEAGARALLIDEDTAATNFMIRDHRMQALVPKDREPITPFIDRVRQLYDGRDVSSILVVGGSGDYLDVADTVIAMHAYRPRLVTGEARQVAAMHPTGRVPEATGSFPLPPARVPLPDSVSARHGRRQSRVKVLAPSKIGFGSQSIDLSSTEQIVSTAQARAIARALLYASQRLIDGRRSLPEILDEVARAVAERGLDALDSRKLGNLAGFRRFELAAALNRLRSLQIRDGVTSTDSETAAGTSD